MTKYLGGHLQFKEHGIYSITVTGRLMTVDSSGPYNDEALKHYMRDLQLAVTSFQKRPWLQLNLVHDFSVFTPEAEKMLENSMRYRKEMGMIASAIVLLDVQGKPLIIHQLTRCCKNAGINYAFFEDIPAAQAWLTEHDLNDS